jgi:hypothetical protein
MNIKEMHYDLKSKLNKLDSEQYRNLKVPEIDWKLNEAIELFVKIVAEPKYVTKLGFEISQRVIDDIRPLVVDSEVLTKTTEDEDTATFSLPDKYFDFVSTDKLIIKQGSCEVKAEKIFVRQHDDTFQSSTFDKSNFLWREVNIRFFKGGIKVFTSGEFSVESFKIDFIKQPISVNNSESYIGGSYKTLAGVTLNTNVDCDLPIQAHREIVDLAVAIISGDLEMPGYQIKKDKLRYNQLV